MPRVRILGQNVTMQNVSALFGTTVDSGTSSGIPLYSTATASSPQSQDALPDMQQNAVKKRAKYFRGTASESYRSLAGKLPEYFENKVLVISPVSKDLNQNQIK